MAHDFDKKWRSQDVQLQENIDFSGMLLNDRVLSGLTKAGFKKPSPIQLASIPIGRVGKDLIVQAKSGTGKTLVFVIVALEMLKRKLFRPQILVLVPTREIATQICSVVKSLGTAYPKLTCCSFIGGLPVVEDKEKALTCQIVVGTPGRIKQLVCLKSLPTNSIRLLVFDEADELFHPSFKQDVEDIFNALPHEKQVIATSATYPVNLTKIIFRYLRDPYVACLNTKELALLGIVQYAKIVEFMPIPFLLYKNKLAALEEILKTIKFSQCLLFCNGVQRVEVLYKDIKKWGFSTTYISSAKEQCDRLKAIDRLKHFKCKVLVSSDVTARGIDAEFVDLVINFDLIYTAETFMHRVGRAGRFGSMGVSITLITEKEILQLKRIEQEGSFKTYKLPDPVPADLIRNPVLGEYAIEDQECELINQKSEEFKTDVINDDKNAPSGEFVTETSVDVVGQISNGDDNDLSKLIVEKLHCTSETKILPQSIAECAHFSDKTKPEESKFANDISSTNHIAEHDRLNDIKPKVINHDSYVSSKDECHKISHFSEADKTQVESVGEDLFKDDKESESKNCINLEVCSSTFTNENHVSGSSENINNETNSVQPSSELGNDSKLDNNLEKIEIENINQKITMSNDVSESIKNKGSDDCSQLSSKCENGIKMDNKLNNIVNAFISEYEMKQNMKSPALEKVYELETEKSQSDESSGKKIISASMINNLNSCANDYFYRVFKKSQENVNECQPSTSEDKIEKDAKEVDSISLQNEDSEEKKCALNITNEEHNDADITNTVKKSNLNDIGVFPGKPHFESTPQLSDKVENKSASGFLNKPNCNPASRSKLMLLFQHLSNESDSDDKETKTKDNIGASQSFTSNLSESESSSDSSDSSFSSSSSSSTEEEINENIYQHRYRTGKQNPSLISSSTSSVCSKKRNSRSTRKYKCSNCTCSSAKRNYQPLPPPAIFPPLPYNFFQTPHQSLPHPHFIPPLPCDLAKTSCQSLHHAHRKNHLEHSLPPSGVMSHTSRGRFRTVAANYQEHSKHSKYPAYGSYSQPSEHHHNENCFKPSGHRCHPDTKEYVCNHRKLCAQMYKSFCDQWQQMQNFLK